MRIILAFDSFKECMTSRQAADAAEAGIRLADPAMPVISLPGADGGEGTAECLASSFEAIPVSAKVHDPLMNNVNATYRISPASGKAFIDVAAASGLHLVPVEKRNPMVSSSYGTGELIMDAIRRGASDITICLGGSATNDGGAGMLQALGAKFHLRGAGLCGSTVIPAMFERIGHIDISPLTEILKRVRFTGAYDTDAVFTGEKGASMIYSGQKGADRKMKTDLDTCLDKLHTLYTEATGSFCRQFPASGAAGGIGGAVSYTHLTLPTT